MAGAILCGLCHAAGRYDLRLAPAGGGPVGGPDAGGPDVSFDDGIGLGSAEHGMVGTPWVLGLRVGRGLGLLAAQRMEALATADIGCVQGIVALSPGGG